MVKRVQQMKFWAKQVVRLSDGHLWAPRSQGAFEGTPCACVGMRVRPPLSSSLTPPHPQVPLPLLCTPHLQCRGCLSTGPVVRAGSCCQCPCCVLSIPSRVMICFARLAIWACTAACPLLFGRPWCQAGLPVKTLWVVQDPCHLGWC